MIPHLTALEFLTTLQSRRGTCSYGAMYSSWVGGIVTDPALMILPIDDHIVHRGDGVFEAIRFSPHGIYLFEAHIARLARSSEAIGLELPEEPARLAEVCRQVIRASSLENGLLRIFVSRGPGDFTANPYTTRGSQLYVIAVPMKPVSEEKYSKGASLVLSQVPIKPGIFSTIKSCNYLPNVLTTKDAIDRHADFAITITPEGFIAEGAVENILLLDKNRRLVAPKFDYSLRGTTLERVLELITPSVRSDLGITEIAFADVLLEELQACQEIMMVGTTLEVLPITRFEGLIVGDGKVGVVSRMLRELLNRDIYGEKVAKI